MVADILARILESKRREVALARQAVSLETLRQEVDSLPPTRDFWDALRPRDGAATRIIAEIKKASPSAGVIRADFDALAIAATYARHGAAAISVLTDKPFFQGDLGILKAVRRHVDLPLLRKDFILDAYQLYEARSHGADAVLLIAAALEVPVLTDLAALSRELGMEPFVEVHTAAELEESAFQPVPPDRHQQPRPAHLYDRCGDNPGTSADGAVQPPGRERERHPGPGHRQAPGRWGRSGLSCWRIPDARARHRRQAGPVARCRERRLTS